MIAGGAAEIGFADFKFLYHIQTNLMIDNSCFIFVLLRYSLSADKLTPTDKENTFKSKENDLLNTLRESIFFGGHTCLHCLFIVIDLFNSLIYEVN